MCAKLAGARARETKGPDRPGGIVWSTNTTQPPPGGSDSVVAPARVARVEAVRGVVVAVAVDGRALAARPRQDVVDVREVVLGRVLRRPRLTGGRRAGGRRRPERRPEVGRRPPARARGGAPVRLAAPSAAGAPLRVAALAERSQEVPQRRVDGVQGLARAARKVGPDLARLHEQRRQRLRLRGEALAPRALVQLEEPPPLRVARRLAPQRFAPAAQALRRASLLPSAHYLALVADGKITRDEHQLTALAALDRVYAAVEGYAPPAPAPAQPSGGLGGALGAFARRVGLADAPAAKTARGYDSKAPRGAYVHGGVGAGKTFTMDMFFDLAPTASKQRVHFHAFMLSVHRRLHDLQGDDRLKLVAADVLREGALVCFDEFQVTDIADALIMKALFEHLFEGGAVVVATSNRRPRDLYACLLYTSPSPRDKRQSRMPSSA